MSERDCPQCVASKFTCDRHYAAPQTIEASSASSAATGQEVGREAFKAGWRTNAVGEETHPASYLDGCEQTDWEEYQRVGLNAYVAALSPSEAVEPAPEQGVDLRLEWRDGPPPKPWSGEWFIAETTFRDRVVLTALPEEYAYDFKTADDTYIMADRITRWMQFPDSQYIAPDAHPSPAPQQPQSEGLDDKGDAGEAYKRGIYDAKCWLRDQQHKNPPDSLWHAAAILADRMDVALLSSRPAPDTQTAAIGAEAIEAIAQFLHDEGGFAEAWSGRTWPEHPDDTGQRDGAFVKIVPSDVQAKFRDVATRLLHGFPALEEAARLRDALAYYANDEHYDGGDVPGHVYVLDDHGRTARAALSQPVAAPQAEIAGGEAYLICKGGAYYRPNAQGYTRDKAEAGRYTLEEANSHSHPNGPDGPRDGITYELAPPQPEGGTVTKWPSTCDGIEQDAFEEWAKGERMVMDTHPIHWLFLNAETAAARKGWKAGLLHAVNRIAALTPEKSK